MRITPTGPRGIKTYKHGKGLFPSVTEILRVLEKPWYAQWRNRVGAQEADKTMKAAQVFGTKLHKAAELTAWGEVGAVEPDMRPYAEAVREFLGAHVLEVLGTEVELVSPKLGFGGTCDLYGQMHDGSYFVADFKSSGQLTREHGLQVAGYGLLLKEAGYRVNKRIVVRIKKDQPGKWYARAYEDHERDVEAFLAAKTLWYWLNRNKLKAAA